MGAVKVKEVNLEIGNPTVDVAMRNLVNILSTAKGAGNKAVVLVHGNGTTGVGGAIKTARKSKLKESSLIGVVKAFTGGEAWLNDKKMFLEACSQLKNFDRYIDGNKGVTVILLK